VRRRGVAGFKRAFSLGRYVLAPDETDPELERYLDLLIGAAAASRRVPVLGCNRTGLRMGWIKTRFASFDIHVERDPDLMWASYMEHAKKGNYSYFTNLLSILELNADHPLLSPLARRLPLRSGVSKLVRRKHFYQMAVREMAHEISYAIVLYFWTVKLLHAMTFSDVILDASLSQQPSYRRRAGDAVAQSCGVTVSFDALRRVGAATDVSIRDRLAAERLVLDLVPEEDLGLFDRHRVEGRLSEIAPAKAAFLDRVLARTACRKAA
jgi:hypothetical protein